MPDDRWEHQLKSDPFHNGGLRPELRASIRERIRAKAGQRKVSGVNRMRRMAAAAACALAVVCGVIYAASQPELWQGEKRTAEARLDQAGSIGTSGAADALPSESDAIRQEVESLRRQLDTLDLSEFEKTDAEAIRREVESIKRQLDATDPSSDQPIELKVLQNLVGDFMRRYGHYFEAANPNVSLALTRPIRSDGSYQTFTLDELRTYIREEKPDLVMLTYRDYTVLAKEGLLLPLDFRAMESGIDDSTYHPVVLDALRSAGDGRLYGLAEEYYASMAFANVEAFHEAGLALPDAEERLDWHTLLDIGASLQAEGYEGLIPYGDSPFGLADAMGRSLGIIDYYDPKTGEPAVDSEEWRNIWEIVKEGVGERAIFYNMRERVNGSYEAAVSPLPSPLAKGGGALYYGSVTALRSTVPEDQIDKWQPLPPIGNVRRDMWIGYVFAIPAAAEHPEEAWALLKTMIGDERKGDPDDPSSDIRLYTNLGKAERVLGREWSEALLRLDVPAHYIVEEGRMQADVRMMRMYAAYQTEGAALMEDVLFGRMNVDDALRRLERKLVQAAASVEP